MITRKKSRIPIARISEQLFKKEKNCGTNLATQSRIQRSQPQQHEWQHPQSWQSLEQERMEKFAILYLGLMTKKARFVIWFFMNHVYLWCYRCFPSSANAFACLVFSIQGFGLTWWRNQCEQQGLWTWDASHVPFLASAQSIWTPHFVVQERGVQFNQAFNTD